MIKIKFLNQWNYCFWLSFLNINYYYFIPTLTLFDNFILFSIHFNYTFIYNLNNSYIYVCTLCPLVMLAAKARTLINIKVCVKFVFISKNKLSIYICICYYYIHCYLLYYITKSRNNSIYIVNNYSG